jgi:hypothetical protein
MNSKLLTYISQARRMKKHGFHLPGFSRLARDYPRWKKILSQQTTSVEARLPWMTFSSIRSLEKNINRSMNVFEYGCGGSTLFLCEHAEKVVSVEHDKGWFQLLSDKINELQLQNWEGRIIEPEFEASKVKSIADPDEYGTADAQLNQYRFKKYAEAIDEFEDGKFDWVLVDGRARPGCLKHATPKVKPGGFLLLDNSDREYYLEMPPPNFSQLFRVVCDDAGPAPFMAEFSKTTIWQKVKV